MSLLSKKYNYLKPTIDYLCDKIVLAQAWKKSHQYIRSTNWYADTFELDRSAIDLDRLLDSWIFELKSNNFSFNPLRIVPAPKAERWEFKEKNKPSTVQELLVELNSEEKHSHVWQPVESVSKSLRPLAHVSIRDQTLLMALMMCLANKVESIQGNTMTPFDEVHLEQISSYGNRLYCNFFGKEANFSWGNSTSYSKYFSDYQRFLERSIYFGGEALQQKIKNEKVHEIHLDIAKFYDCVERKILIEKIRVISEKDNDAILNNLLLNFLKWKWDETSADIYSEVCKVDNENIPLGIPQGLVIGGFLANIYLMDFDQEIRDLIGISIAENIRVVDYCRYVDDMRLIVVCGKEVSETDIRKAIAERIDPELQKIGLSINPIKTRVDQFRYKRAGISTKLKNIQKKVSGPMSPSELDEQLGYLEGLMSLAENLQASDTEQINTNPLAIIETPSNDVRDDTLMRFSANKIHTLLKQKRSFSEQEVDEEGRPKSNSCDYLQERMARKFIACWSKDPSLVLLLKKGLELFPDKRILKPVLEQLKAVLRRNDEPKQKKIAQYCLGEIFRHSAIFIHTKEKWEFPAHADVNGFFEILQSFAVEVISNEKL